MLRRLPIFLLTCILTFAGVNKLARFPHHESLDFYFEDDFRTLDTLQGHYSVILGNSRSLSGIHGPTLSNFSQETFLHLGYSSSDMVTAQLTLTYALRQNPDLERVIIEVSPFHFDSRRVHSHGIRNYFFQKEPSLLISQGKTWADFSNVLPKSSTLPQLKMAISSDLSRSDFSRRWDCNFKFKRNKLNWIKVIPNQRLIFEESQILALNEISSICKARGVKLIVIFAPTDTVFQDYLENYWDYKTLVESTLETDQLILDFDQGQFQEYLKDADHIGCPEKFTEEIIIPALPELRSP